MQSSKQQEKLRTAAVALWRGGGGAGSPNRSNDGAQMRTARKPRRTESQPRQMQMRGRRRDGWMRMVRCLTSPRRASVPLRRIRPGQSSRPTACLIKGHQGAKKKFTKKLKKKKKKKRKEKKTFREAGRPRVVAPMPSVAGVERLAAATPCPVPLLASRRGSLAVGVWERSLVSVETPCPPAVAYLAGPLVSYPPLPPPIPLPLPLPRPRPRPRPCPHPHLRKYFFFPTPPYRPNCPFSCLVFLFLYRF